MWAENIRLSVLHYIFSEYAAKKMKLFSFYSGRRVGVCHKLKGNIVKPYSLWKQPLNPQPAPPSPSVLHKNAADCIRHCARYFWVCFQLTFPAFRCINTLGVFPAQFSCFQRYKLVFLRLRYKTFVVHFQLNFPAFVDIKHSFRLLWPQVTTGPN